MQRVQGKAAAGAGAYVRQAGHASGAVDGATGEGVAVSADARWIHAFYRCGAWLRKRAEILTRDNFECQKCKRRGKMSRAECVHHIKFLLNRPDLALDDSNLTSLCNICHNHFHPEKLRRDGVKRRIVSSERW